jgi:hypothetical protein
MLLDTSENAPTLEASDYIVFSENNRIGNIKLTDNIKPIEYLRYLPASRNTY